MVVVQRVPTQFVARVWPQVEGFVASVEEHAHGEWTLAQMKSDVHMGRISMVAVMDGDQWIGVVLYSVQNRRNGRTAFISVCAGKLLTTQRNWEQLKAIFISEGATDVEAAMRPTVLRLWQRLGFKEKYSIAGVKL